MVKPTINHHSPWFTALNRGLPSLRLLFDQVEVLEFYSRYNKVEYPQEPKGYSNHISSRHFFQRSKAYFDWILR